MINYQKIFLTIGLCALQQTIYALTPPSGYTLTGKNNFVFIENNIDKEYLIASEDLDPRFTGNNVWTKYGKNKQDSLGYMGRNTRLRANNNIDIWLENSAMLYPFQGLRCRIRNANECPSTGFIPPAFTDQYGAYKMRSGDTEFTGHAARGSFSSQAYEFLKNQAVGSFNSYDMHYCETTEDYDPAAGGRCKDATTGRWRKTQLNITKTGNISFVDTRAFSEIWISTDGTPTLAADSQLCEHIVISSGGDEKSGQREGISCKMLQYNIDAAITNLYPGIRFYMVVDTAALGNINLNEYDIRLDGGNGAWKRFSEKGSDNSMRGMFTTGQGYVRVLFTKAFFRKMLAAGASTSGRQGVFTFAIDNTVTPQSGFYQFSSGVDIDIIPREYGISIRHQDQYQQKKTGKIGEDEEDIVFNYIVTQSAPRKADTVTASVIGESTTVKSMSYCLFKSNDNSLNVAIPAYLSYTHETGNIVEQYSGCNANATLDLTHAAWTATPWDVQQSGYFYSTDLKLRFPMNDRVSQFTVDKGIDWLGSVHAEGDVKVEAKWIGVDR
ncbi:MULTISPECIES: hypothetical protein [unclassified Acinetobacter]|uniref:hypothetical protein n=1 Tax=unclassified Acinetobacter TaxID=196816 RepID=UPI002934C2E7|nr:MULTISPECIES: hypothetical protein [unclassified Acinetobacter]WOE32312.1 hypothetical protein QSG84_03630 [Acinetobacter sp. SAAs470]WOE37783.1 hypothetical protein QSG86_12675 [Acinetobacter sp. SAAs474]